MCMNVYFYVMHNCSDVHSILWRMGRGGRTPKVRGSRCHGGWGGERGCLLPTGERSGQCAVPLTRKFIFWFLVQKRPFCSIFWHSGKWGVASAVPQNMPLCNGVWTFVHMLNAFCYDATRHSTLPCSNRCTMPPNGTAPQCIRVTRPQQWHTSREFRFAAP